MSRYIGRIATVPAGEQFGFISIASVTNEDGSPHKLRTKNDIFVHQDDSATALRVGDEVAFEVTPDQQRKASFRAVAVVEHFNRELLLVGEFRTDVGFVNPQGLYVQPSPTQKGMKTVDAGTVQQVLANRPMEGVPRAYPTIDEPQEITRRLLQRVFPQFYPPNELFPAGATDAELDTIMREVVEGYRAVGMQTQADYTVKLLSGFKGLRSSLELVREDGLVRPETFIPIQYLPDLFMAVPVWYFWANDKIHKSSQEIAKSPDPRVHDHTAYFCDLIGGQEWSDTFLMFNRRIRTLQDYKGDMVPQHILRRMGRATELFDYLVVMTPYHDVAGADWEDIAWLRSIDPYVVGFIKEVPLMFVLARFSDSGVFPLHTELVADTIAFLRANIQKLEGFNKVGSPYWYKKGAGKDHCQSGCGTHLIEHTQRLLGAFDEGTLFDWLRGQNPEAA